MGKSFPSLEVVLELYFSMMALGMSRRRMLLSTLVFFLRVMIHVFPFEVKIDYTPGNLNQISSIGVHEGQLYVEIQTELDHSDIHVLDLDEDE